MTAPPPERPAPRPRRKTGHEPLHEHGHPLPHTLLDFWRWSSSDVVGNALRGHFAEFLVASALDMSDGTRTEWDGVDLRVRDGPSIEVKSAARVQSWAQPAPSRIGFDIAPTRGWHAETNTWSVDRRRQADVYVFALLHHDVRETLDPLDVSQWEFFVVPRATLDAQCGTQKQIGLTSLRRLAPASVAYAALGDAIRAAAP